VATVDIKDVKRLKDLTGVGLTDAKAALEETGGDFDKALQAMRKKGLTKAEKRSEREAREGVVASYIHDDRIGVLVEVNCETDFVARNEIFTSLVKDITMHIAAANPEYADQSQVPKDELKKLEAEFREKAKSEGKPADMLGKIAAGQLSKYFEEHCLVDQPFIKNPDISVGEYIKEHGARLGENIVVRRFSRMALGEVS
jgi:elongation factor Ts